MNPTPGGPALGSLHTDEECSGADVRQPEPLHPLGHLDLLDAPSEEIEKLQPRSCRTRGPELKLGSILDRQQGQVQNIGRHIRNVGSPWQPENVVSEVVADQNGFGILTVIDETGPHSQQIEEPKHVCLHIEDEHSILDGGRHFRFSGIMVVVPQRMDFQSGIRRPSFQGDKTVSSRPAPMHARNLRGQRVIRRPRRGVRMVVVWVDAHVEFQGFDIVHPRNTAQGVQPIGEAVSQHISLRNGGLLSSIMDDGEHAEIILEAVDFHGFPGRRLHDQRLHDLCLTHPVINPERNIGLCRKHVSRDRGNKQNKGRTQGSHQLKDNHFCRG